MSAESNDGVPEAIEPELAEVLISERPTLDLRQRTWTPPDGVPEALVVHRGQDGQWWFIDEVGALRGPHESRLLASDALSDYLELAGGVP